MQVTLQLTDYSFMLPKPGAVTIVSEGPDKIKFIMGDKYLVLSAKELKKAMTALDLVSD